MGVRVARAEVEQGDALQVEGESERGDHHLAKQGGASQRPEHEEVGSEPDHGGHGEGDDEGDRHWHLTGVAERDLHGQVQRVGGQDVDPRKEDLALVPRPVERGDAVHRHRAHGEVDDARALVDDHQAGAQHGVERPDADAGDQVKDDVVHLDPSHSPMR